MKKPLLALAVVLAFGVAALHIYLRANNPSYNLFIPPSDLYGGSVESDFSLSELNLESDLEAFHKYPGRYMVALAVDRPASIGSYYEDNFLVEISAQSAGVAVLEGSFPQSENSFQGGDWGFLPLMVYSVPEDVPIRESINFKIRLIEVDSDFASKYGSTRIHIGKVSDE